MSPDQPQRLSALLGTPVPGGRVADVITTPDGDGREVITAVLVTSGRWGRLLGYERDRGTGPWLLHTIARYVMHRHTSVVPWEDLRTLLED